MFIMCAEAVLPPKAVETLITIIYLLSAYSSVLAVKAGRVIIFLILFVTLYMGL